MVGDASGVMEISMKDIIECEAGQGTTFALQWHEHKKPAQGMSGIFNRAIGITTTRSTLEVRAATKQEQKRCVAVLAGRPILSEDPDPTEFAELVEEHRLAVEALDPTSRTCKQHLFSVVNWFCFPVLLALEITVPTCFSPSTRRQWLLTFLVSMAWLAFFSYWICVMADALHANFGVPDSLLGLTLTAVGTSFPNCVASVIVARKGQCSMAVANALGSNIQNVFFALGVPWFINAAINGGHFAQPTNGIRSGVISMAGSLGLFVAFIVAGRSSLGKLSAAAFLLGYVAFFIFTVLEAYYFI
jgi:Ca2+/Na+ antiporter